MIDLRYLALTLIGVFLALAVGLMTGSALNSPDRRDRVYEGLQQQFELLRTQNQNVQEENDTVRRRIQARDRAVRELLPAAVRDRLPGSTIAVVLCGPVDERPFWSDLQDALRLAGARVGPVLRIPDTLRALEVRDRAVFAQLWEPDALYEEPEPFEAAGWAMTALARGTGTERLQQLVRLTGMELRGDLRTPFRRVLVLAGASDDPRAAAIAAGDVPEAQVVDAARAEGLRVVAAEPEEGTASAVEPLRRRNIPTVDNVDTPTGQISAVLALAGADGHFGSRPGAARPLPPLERR
jgi:hypothetical protein